MQKRKDSIWMAAEEFNREAIIRGRPWVKWYKTAAWQRIRRKQLALEPLCRFCSKKDIVTPANTVDHVIPHRGNMNLFFTGPFQSLCKTCHSGQKQRLEKSGEFGCDERGYPGAWQ